MLSTSPALLEVFKSTYFKTAQQKQSKFQKSGVLEYDNANGAIHNLARVKPFEVAAITAKTRHLIAIPRPLGQPITVNGIPQFTMRNC